MKKHLLITLIFIGVLGIFDSLGQDFSIKLRNSEFKNIDSKTKNRVSATEFSKVDKYFIIQFNTIPTSKERKDLYSSGIELLDYIPNNAYIAKKLSSKVKFVSKSGFAIVRLEKFKADYKLDYRIYKKNIPSWAIPSIGTIKINVVGFENIDFKDEIFKNIEILSFKNIGPLVYELEIKEEDVNELASVNVIKFIELVKPEKQLHVKNQKTSHRANVVNSELAIGKGLHGDGIVVGEFDGGQVYEHEDLLANIIVHTENGYSDHSTHVAGSIIGKGLINPEVKGMAPNAQLHSWDFYADNTMLATDTAIDEQNLNLVTNSWGYGFSPYSCYDPSPYGTNEKGYDEVALKYPNVLQIFSAGNDRESCSGGYKTAGWNMKNVLFVGAVDNYDQLAYFSSCGPLSDGRIAPHIVGMGVEVYSTELYNKYMDMSGTSMSTPAVTGSVALLYEAYHKKNNEYPLSSLTKAIVCNTAKDLGNNGPDFQYGFGRIDILKAVESVENDWFFKGSSNQDQTNEHIINVDANTKELKVTLDWSDVAGYEGSQIALVNNLDLTVVTPSGETILPFVLDPENPSDVATLGVDEINNTEQIVIKNPVAGDYKIKVKGTKVQSRCTYSVAYFKQEEDLKIIFPIGDEVLIAGNDEFIRWNTSNNSDPVNIYFSEDDGANWTELINNLNANDNNYKVTIPEITSNKCMVKIQQGEKTTLSEAFVISPVPEIVEIEADYQSALVKWRKFKTAKSYNIYKINNGEINLLQTLADTFYTVTKLETNDPSYYAVQANFEGYSSQRSLAVVTTPIPKVDLAIKAVVNPLGGGLLTGDEPIIIRLVNYGADKLLAGTKINAKYSLNDAAPVEDVITLSKDLERNETYDYTFSKNAYLAIEKYYSFEFEIKYDSDTVITKNNVLIWSLLHNEIITQYPYSENFNLTAGLSLTTVWDHVYLGRGWVNDCLTDDFEWWPWGSDTYKDGSGPSKDHTSGTGKFLYTESFFLDGKVGTFNVFSPLFNISSLTQPTISFWYHMYAETLEMGSLHVDLYSVNEDKWYNDLWTLSGSQADKWQNARINISEYKNKGLVKLRYRVISSETYQNSIAIDDFELYEDDIYDLKIDSVGLNEDGGLLSSSEKIKIYYTNLGGREIAAGEKISFSYKLNQNTDIVEEWTVVDPIKTGENLFYEFTATADLEDITKRNSMDFEVDFSGDYKKSNNKIKSLSVQSYIEPESACTVGYYFMGLYNFSFEGIYEETSVENYNSSCATTEISGYSFYGEKIARVYRGEKYQIGAQAIPYTSIEGLSPLGQFVKIWVDYNQNGLFEVDEEIFESDHRAIIYMVDSIEIPEDALLGRSRIRVRTSYNLQDLEGEGAAEQDIDYGETEDYTIEIVDQPQKNVELQQFVDYPTTFSNLNSDEIISVKVANVGLNDIEANSEFNISYSVNGSVVTEKYSNSETFSLGQSFVYEFNQKLNLATKGKYNMKVWVDFEEDQDHFNDTLYLSPVSLSEEDVVDYLADFENINESNWYASSTKNRNVWEQGQPSTPNLNAAHSGNYCWGTVLDNVYLPRTESILYSPVFDFTKSELASVSFWLSSVAEPNYDGMILETSFDGITWDKIGENENGFYNSDYKGSSSLGSKFWSDYSEGWKKKEVTVDQLCGKKAAFRFRFISDENQVFEGFTMDDFKIDVTTSTTGIENGLSSDFDVYPNPFKNEINIHLSDNLVKNVLVKLIDMNGIVQYNEDMQTQNILNINLENLHNGIYTIQVITGDKIYSKQIIKY